jgi:FkbM family methyltransferase
MSKVGIGDTEQTGYLKSARCTVEGIFVLQNRNRLQRLCRWAFEKSGLGGDRAIYGPSTQQNLEMVHDLYRVILQRQADPVGLAEKTAALDSGERTVAALVEEMVHSAEYLSRFDQVAGQSSGDYKLLNSVAQYDELFHLLRAVLQAHFAEAYVVDCGARGRDRSNSYDLLKFFGWKGLLIEANPALIPEIEREFADLDYTIIQCAVSDRTGNATLTIGINDDVSSIDPVHAAAWGQTQGEVVVPMRRLPEILESHCAPKIFGLLSLDVEGQDIAVLNDLIDNSDFRPQYIIIEASYDFRTKTLDDLPFSEKVKKAYVIVGQTSPNLILSCCDLPGRLQP